MVRPSILLASVLSATLLGVAPEPSAERFHQIIRVNDLTALDAAIAAGADVNVRDADGMTPLMYGAAFGSADAMKRLIAKGADVNARNNLESSALTWAINDIEKVRLLIGTGADVNAASKPGRTPLLVATLSNPSIDVVKLLVARGADVHAIDRLKATAMHTAAGGGDLETLRLLLDAKLDVNARDAADFTPLMIAAANGDVAAVKLLLSRGARVNDVSGNGEPHTHAAAFAKNGMLSFGSFTALLLAAPGGSADLIKALLDAGADVNAKDMRGMTALMLAVATDHFDVEKIRLLLTRGAGLAAQSREGETALDWARKFGETPVVAVLRAAGAPARAAIAQPTLKAAAPVDLQAAVARGVGLMERTTSAQFVAKGGCAACHAQNMMDVVASVARTKGLRLDDKETASRLAATKTRFAVSVPHLLERLDVPGTPDVPLSSMFALATIGYAPDRMTDAVTINIAVNQYPDGRWHGAWNARPPIQDGDIGRTALAIRVLKAYAPPALAAEMNGRLARAKRWIESATPVTTADHAMRLLGLRWAGSDEALIAKTAASLLATQRPDGGWAQRDELSSDAYATGQTLYALTAGASTPRTDPAFQRGIRFLLSTQQADGSWYVASRSVKFQPYFESGFPYGGDQWISQMATGWATTALAGALDAAPPASTVAR